MVSIKVLGLGTGGVTVASKFSFYSWICDMQHRIDTYESMDEAAKANKWLKSVRYAFYSETGTVLTRERFISIDPFKLIDTIIDYTRFNGMACMRKHMKCPEGLDVYTVDSNLDHLQMTFPIIDHACLIGYGLFHGHDTNKNFEAVKIATLEKKERIKSLLKGADVVIVVAGLGGGVGTVASELIAEWSKKEWGAITIIVAIEPSNYGTKNNITESTKYLKRVSEEDNTNLLCSYKIDDYIGNTKYNMSSVVSTDMAICEHLERFYETLKQSDYNKCDIESILKAFC